MVNRNVARSKNRWLLSGKATLLLMAVPCFVLLVAFVYLPLWGWSIAFFDYKAGLKFSQMDFMGFKSFTYMFKQPNFANVIRNTLVMSGLYFLTSPVPAIFAILLAEMNSKRVRQWIQTTTTLPYFISWVLVYAVFFSLFSVGDGIVNTLLLNFGWIKQPLNPLANPHIVWFFQTGIYLWKNLGFSAIIYIAAITSIDPELYDAASVDGAGRLNKIKHITVPGLVSTFLTLLLLGIGNLLNNGFEQYYLFYNAIVADKIEVLDYFIYRIGITMSDYSLSTAIGIFKTLFSILLITVANMIAKRVRGSGII
ncbi:ABC transporter permease subunit [Cohnella silvisoli]|uniref:ABC transporter permease subunit n=1 Tax=Cohnella silvisoli TaxID=2873699 RepID=A0ABV1KTW0_9BACL|nr:ABC transporter permease subunit [Cohnella silvisoli]